jgi:molybdenum cofactor guanylyltransferase
VNLKHNIPTYILCGGKSSRMHTEKGLVKYRGKPFIKWSIEAAVPLSKAVYLVTDNQDYKPFGYELVPDYYKSKGPVGGIFSAMQHTNSPYILVLSCDIPKINSEVLKNYLIEHFDETADVNYLSDGERDFPLIGIYKAHLKTYFEAQIKDNCLRLINLIHRKKCNKIIVSKQNEALLANVNTPFELKLLNQY